MNLRPWLAAMLLTAAAPTPGLELALQQARSGNYYLPVTLNRSVETTLLLDTGSGYVSLSPATFKRLRDDEGTVFQRRITGRLADGQSLVVPIYRIRELRLGSACVLRDIEVAVMPGGARDILGLNALRHLQPFTLQLDPPLLSSPACG